MRTTECCDWESLNSVVIVGKLPLTKLVVVDGGAESYVSRENNRLGVCSQESSFVTSVV